MFDDFFSSSRGPGLIGFLLAALVLGGFTGLGMIAFEDSEAKPSLDQLVKQQELQILELEARVKNEKAKETQFRDFRRLLGELNQETASLTNYRKNLQEKQDELQKANDEVDRLISNWEDYKTQYRQSERRLARGEVFDFSSSLGPEYEESKVREINAIEMRVMLENGPKSIPYEKLPQALQERFQFDPAEAQAMREEMQRMEQVRQIRGAQAQETLSQQKMEEKAATTAGDIAKIRKQIVRLKQRAISNESAIKEEEGKAKRLRQDHERARARGGISMHLGSARQAEARAASLRKQNVEFEQQIQVLERRLRTLESGN